MDVAIRLCHLPSPPSSLWTAAGGQEEGVVLFKSQSLSSLGQWLRERRDPGVLEPQPTTEVVSGARRDRTVHLGEGWE